MTDLLSLPTTGVTLFLSFEDASELEALLVDKGTYFSKRIAEDIDSAIRHEYRENQKIIRELG
tara:strand:- start:944 stop:1132 length:189 start_codon:yes stop_codon:yes gene_type:complete